MRRSRQLCRLLRRVDTVRRVWKTSAHVYVNFVTLLIYAAVLTGRIMGLACLSLHPSVFPSVRLSNSKAKRLRKVKTGLNVSQSMSNRFANFLKWLNVQAIGCQKRPEASRYVDLTS